MDVREAARWLRERDNYLILTHKRPDGDTIGCGVGLCQLLRELGKTAWLLDSLDAVSSLRGYLEGCVAPADYVPETVVSVDVATGELLPDNAAPYRERVDLAIDHHGSHRPFAALCCLNADRAACGEIIWELCRELGVMTPAIAAPLYVAVATDCGCFVYDNTTPHTHRVAAELMEQGIPHQTINRRHFRTRSMARLRLEGLVLSEVELLYDGALAVACVPLSMMERAGAGEDDAEDISALPGQIEGTLGSVVIRELRSGQCKVSVRTQARWLDANGVCTRMGGGGHPAASGCTIPGDMARAKAEVLAAVAAQFAAAGR